MRRWDTLIYLAIVVGSVALSTVQPAQLLGPLAGTAVDALTAR